MPGSRERRAWRRRRVRGCCFVETVMVVVGLRRDSKLPKLYDVIY